MPTGVKILVQIREMPSDDALQRLRLKLLKDLDLTGEDFYSAGALLPVTGKELSMMPESTPDWLDLNLWRAYFGEGCHRGDLGLYIKCAEWLEENLPDSRVYYGHDVDDENIRAFDSDEREKYLKYYKTVRNQL
jgi:hypothetical protein